MFEFDFEGLATDEDDEEPERAQKVASTSGPATPTVHLCVHTFPSLVDVEVLTLAGEVVASFRAAARGSVQCVKEEIERKLGVQRFEQRLVIAGTESVLDGDMSLREAYKVFMATAVNKASLVSDSVDAPITAMPPLGLLRFTMVQVQGLKRVCLSGGLDGILRVWDLEHDAEFIATSEVKCRNGTPNCLSASWAASRCALLGGSDGVLTLWDMHKENLQLVFFWAHQRGHLRSSRLVAGTCAQRVKGLHAASLGPRLWC